MVGGAIGRLAPAAGRDGGCRFDGEEAEGCRVLPIGAEASRRQDVRHALAEHLAKKVSPQPESDSELDILGDSDGGVLSELFDSVESAPAGSERGI